MAAVVPSRPVDPPSRSGFDSRRIAREAKQLARSSGLAAGLVAAFALVRACRSGAPPEKSLEGLVGALGSSAHVVVQPNEFVWEPSDGVMSDLVFGRRVLFLGAAKAGDPRDLYRARVRLTPEGRPIAVLGVVNLTDTPDSDEQGLVRDATGDRVAFSSYAYGQLQGVTALDLRGEGAASTATTTLEKSMFYVTNLQETGSGKGIARVIVALDQPATSAQLVFDGPTLVAQIVEANGVKLARVDVDHAQLATPVDGVEVSLQLHVPKKFVHWAVDTVRYEVGDEPVAWLEAEVWKWKDRFHRWLFGITGGGGATNQPKSQEATEAAIAAARALDPSAAGEDGGYWPPKKVPSMFEEPEAGEGEWVEYHPAWMHAIEGAPSPFYRTYVRPDPVRAYSKIEIVAMDTRQLDLQIEGGVEDPKPTVGSFHGAGRLPRDPAIAPHVVAAFNGGFKTEHGHYGMMEKKHIMLPPVPNAATAVVLDDGKFGMGAWPANREIPADLLSYRQNMDPLVEDGIFNPRKRLNWGAVLPNQKNMTGQQTERSGLCVTTAGHLLYLWGDDVGPDALGKAMQLASCDFGMHLDMNPFHTGFVFMSFDDKDYKKGSSETLDAQKMEISNRRYIDYNPKDFFYVMLRDPAPKTPISADGDALSWTADFGVQPPPTWLPGIWKANEGVVTLTRFEANRVRFAARPGRDEPFDAKADVPREIEGDDASRVIAAIGLGAADGKHAMGLVIGKKTAIALDGDDAALVTREDGSIAIVKAGESIAGVDVVQAPLAVDDGKFVEASERGGNFTRSLIGVTKDGVVIVARGTGTSDAPLAKALIDAGAVRAIATRSAKDAFLDRAGTSAPPMSSYGETTLYAIARPMLPRAFRFDRDAAGQPLWPKVTQPVP